MVDPRSRIFMKIIIDLLFIVLVIATCSVDEFSYMKHYSMGLLNITIKMDYEGSLDAYVVASYNDFKDTICDNSERSLSLQYVCEMREDFRIAGILFLVFSLLSLVLVAYGILNLMGMALGCTFWGVFKFQFVHYTYPLIYVAGTLTYVLVSEVFSLSSHGYDEDYGYKAKPGIVLMFINIAVVILSMIYFIYGKKKRMDSLLLITQEGQNPPKTRNTRPSTTRNEPLFGN